MHSCDSLSLWFFSSSLISIPNPAPIITACQKTSGPRCLRAAIRFPRPTQRPARCEPATIKCVSSRVPEFLFWLFELEIAGCNSQTLETKKKQKRKQAQLTSTATQAYALEGSEGTEEKPRISDLGRCRCLQRRELNNVIMCRTTYRNAPLHQSPRGSALCD